MVLNQLLIIIINNFIIHSDYGIIDKEVVLGRLKIHEMLSDKIIVLTDLAVESHVHLLDRSSRSGLCYYILSVHNYVKSIFVASQVKIVKCKHVIIYLQTLH